MRLSGKFTQGVLTVVVTNLTDPEKKDCTLLWQYRLSVIGANSWKPLLKVSEYRLQHDKNAFLLLIKFCNGLSCSVGSMQTLLAPVAKPGVMPKCNMSIVGANMHE